MTLFIANDLAIPGRLHATDLSADAGGMIALVGPNGGGKTSLLRALAGVEQATGSVRVDGQLLADLGEARRSRLLALVPASRDVGWPIAARDVVRLGLGQADHARAEQVLDLLELGALAHRPINTLSTGERARVLIARALAASPRLLLLDEPLSNLEPYWVLRLVEILRSVAQKGTTVLAALHDLAQLPAFDRALLVADGRIQMDETPACLVESGRFESIFRIRAAPDGWRIRPGGPQSSP